MDEGMKALTAMASSAKAIHQYQGSDLGNHLDDMLTALADSYRLDLADVVAADLVALQTKLKQTLAIRAVIRGDLELPRV